jgi:hypothetical protein
MSDVPPAGRHTPGRRISDLLNRLAGEGATARALTRALAFALAESLALFDGESRRDLARNVAAWLPDGAERERARRDGAPEPPRGEARVTRAALALVRRLVTRASPRLDGELCYALGRQYEAAAAAAARGDACRAGTVVLAAVRLLRRPPGGERMPSTGSQAALALAAAIVEAFPDRLSAAASDLHRRDEAALERHEARIALPPGARPTPRQAALLEDGDPVVRLAAKEEILRASGDTEGARVVAAVLRSRL